MSLVENIENIEAKMDFSERLQAFMDVIYNEEGEMNEEIDQELFKSVEQEVLEFWEQTKYKPMDLMNLMFIFEIVQGADVKYIDHIYKMCNVKITVKDRKRGKKAIFQRLLRNYHKENVRKTLNSLLETFMRDEIKRCKTWNEHENKMEVISELIEEVGMLPVIWISSEILNDEELIQLMKKEEPIRYTASLAQLAILHLDVDYQTVMEFPEKLDQKDVSVIRKENKQMEKSLRKKDKETNNLKEEVQSLKKEKQKLESDIHELYKSALEEIEQLKQDKEGIQDYFLAVIESLSNQITELQQNEPEEINELDLKGKTIAVIGGSKERHFREIIQKYNGNMTFAAEDDFNKIEGAVRKADAVFFLKEVVGHHFFRQAYPLAKKYNLPFVYLNSIGVSSFERELKRLIS